MTGGELSEVADSGGADLFDNITKQIEHLLAAKEKLSRVPPKSSDRVALCIFSAFT